MAGHDEVRASFERCVCCDSLQQGLQSTASLIQLMPVTLPRLLAVFSFTAALLLPSCVLCAQQSGSAAAGPTASSSLPDAPEPQTAQAPRTDAKRASFGAPVSPSPESITLAGTPRRFLDDQRAIWTSPLHIRPLDLEYLLPLGAATGVLIGSDHHTMTSLIHIRPNDQNRFSTLSTAGVAGLAALPAGMYLWSFGHDAPQAHETSILAGEAAADGLVVNEVFKVIARRDRPLVNNAQGNFFSSSLSDSSFASNHAVAAWSIASVVGEEYPGWLSRTVVYGAAAGVSVSRVLAEQHFPSDVLVGSATGWLIGHYVYRRHHDFSLNVFDSTPMPGELGAPRKPRPPQGSAQTPAQASTLHYAPAPIVRSPPRLFEEDADPDTIGSTNVPMDSWVYPALERLAAMGFIPGQSVSIRPWTRQECLRQLKIAEDLADSTDDYSESALTEAKLVMADLRDKFEREPEYYESLDFESAYARYGTIAGPALADSFHFGQTWWNDFGRPLGRGGSALAGFSLRAHSGRLFFYDRQEEQHGPGNPAETPQINALINTLDRLDPNAPVIAPTPVRSAYNQQRAIELYAGVAFAGNALSAGKQEIYWGPTTMGPLAFSSNAEPTYNLRFVATRPHPIPFFPSLGTYRFDVVIGKLSGHSYPARPWYNGQKADFVLGNNLEISFTRWSIFWGVNHPITLHSFQQNIFSFNSTGGGSGGGGGSLGYGDRADPGDRKSNFDFNWHLPFLSRAVTLYADAYSDDDPSPIDAPRRAVWSPGIYFARLPFLPHMDLRVEAVSSQGLVQDFGGQHFFINNQYLDGNTNKGFLLGNATGRDSRAIEGRSGYWFSARTRVEAGYRQNKGGTGFLPGGSTVTDGFVNGSYAFNKHWQVQTFAQYERFLIPSYLPGSQHNVSGWLSVVWNPELNLHR